MRVGRIPSVIVACGHVQSRPIRGDTRCEGMWTPNMARRGYSPFMTRRY